MRSDRIRSAFHTHCLRLIGCLAALLLASEAAAGPLFQDSFPVNPGGPLGPVLVGDLNGDAVPDLVVINTVDHQSYLRVLLGNGDGTFQAAGSSSAIGHDSFSAAMADLNGDTALDVVSINPDDYGEEGKVLLGNGDGTFHFVAANFIPLGGSHGGVAAIDLDCDTVPDLVHTDYGGNAVSVLSGNGDYTFEAAVSFAVGALPRGVVVADLNGDTTPDLIASNFGSGDLSVLLNLCVPAAGSKGNIKIESGIKPPKIQ